MTCYIWSAEFCLVPSKMLLVIWYGDVLIHIVLCLYSKKKNPEDWSIIKSNFPSCGCSTTRSCAGGDRGAAVVLSEEVFVWGVTDVIQMNNASVAHVKPAMTRTTKASSSVSSFFMRSANASLITSPWAQSPGWGKLEYKLLLLLLGATVRRTKLFGCGVTKAAEFCKNAAANTNTRNRILPFMVILFVKDTSKRTFFLFLGWTKSFACDGVCLLAPAGGCSFVKTQPIKNAGGMPKWELFGILLSPVSKQIPRITSSTMSNTSVRRSISRSVSA